VQGALLVRPVAGQKERLLLMVRHRAVADWQANRAAVADWQANQGRLQVRQAVAGWPRLSVPGRHRADHVADWQASQQRLLLVRQAVAGRQQLLLLVADWEANQLRHLRVRQALPGWQWLLLLLLD